MTNVARMSKQEIRKAYEGLCLLNFGRDWLLSVKRQAEEAGTEEVIGNLLSGARRREILHEDYGSAEQMRFVADVLASHHGPAGLTY
jgi:hypothetical protein